MRKVLLLGLLALGACGGGAEAKRAVSTTVRPATTSTAPTPTTTLVPVPTDPVLVECQTVVNAARTEWTFDDDASASVQCVRGIDISGRAGAYDGTVVKINAEPPSFFTPEQRVRHFRSTAAHELGHAWDVAHLTAVQHSRYMQIRGYVGDWIASRAVEDYADVFSLAMSGLGDETITTYIGTPGFARSTAQVGERPTAEQLATICGERLVPC